MSEKTKSTMLLGLIEAIDKWMDKEAEKDHWQEVGVVPAELAELMARSSLLIMEANAAADGCDRG